MDTFESDQTLKLVTPMHWAALSTLCALLIVAFIYTFFVTVPIYVRGEGGVLSKDAQVVGVVPFPSGEQVREGMKAEITLAYVDPFRYGYLRGKVSAILPMWSEQAIKRFPIKHLFQEGEKDHFIQLIVIDLIPDPTTESGYAWTSSLGAPVSIEQGAPCKLSITIEEKKLISYLIP